MPDCQYDRLMIGSLSLCGVIEGKFAVELPSIADEIDEFTLRFVADDYIHDKGYAFHWRLSSKMC